MSPMRLLATLLAVWLALAAVPSSGDSGPASASPWGTARVEGTRYPPRKVIYDVVSGDPAVLANVLDRASFLSTLYGADPFDGAIVLVVHGDAIELFANRNHARHRELMARAQSLSVGGIIRFRLCRAAARMRGYGAEDVHGFLTLVPMADAEIIRLQTDEGYAYMR